MNLIGLMDLKSGRIPSKERLLKKDIEFYEESIKRNYFLSLKEKVYFNYNFVNLTVSLPVLLLMVTL